MSGKLLCVKKGALIYSGSHGGYASFDRDLYLAPKPKETYRPRTYNMISRRMKKSLFHHKRPALKDGKDTREYACQWDQVQISWDKPQH